MALDPHYITDGPLEEAFLDKSTGLPLAGGFITFYRDSSRITPKAVYQLTGAPPAYQYVALPNPIELSSIGTVQNAGGDNVVIYYYPWLADGVTPDLYYIVVTDSNGVVQFTREAWPNAAETGGSIVSDSLPVQNQISNPQFTQILINDVPTLTPSTTTYTVSGSPLEFDLAPDWTLVVNGTGTVVVERLALQGLLEAPTNPPYALSISVGLTISSCHLRQRFYNNSGLWTSTANVPVFLSTSMVIKNLINANTEVKMFYQASNGILNTTPLQIFDASILALSNYTSYTGSSIEMPMSDDSLSGDAGYVDIYIALSAASSVAITSIQVVPAVEVLTAPLLPYDIASSNRAEALMGDYYIPRVISSPIPSLLTGWDFKLNPAQVFTTTPISVTTTAGYIWDQTICATSGGTAPVTRNAVTGGITFTPDTGTQSMYMIQYLSGAQAKEVLYTRLSSNISAYLGSGGGNVSTSVYLYVAPAATSIPTLPTSLVSISDIGTISGLAAGWNIIPRSGLDTPRGVLSTTKPTEDQDIQFSGWEITDPTILSDTNKFAIVVTFIWDTATVINIDSVSLQKGDLPTRPAAQTASDVLSECQFYYETSKNPGIGLATSGVEGCILAQQFSYIDTFTPTGAYNGRSFGIPYKINKRTAPTVTLYSTDGTINNVQSVINQQGVGQTNLNVLASLWTQTANGSAGVYYLYSTASAVRSGVPTSLFEFYILFHYKADCRLGIIA